MYAGSIKNWSGIGDNTFLNVQGMKLEMAWFKEITTGEFNPKTFVHRDFLE